MPSYRQEVCEVVKEEEVAFDKERAGDWCGGMYVESWVTISWVLFKKKYLRVGM